MFIKFPGRDLNGFLGFLKGVDVAKLLQNFRLLVRVHVQLLVGLYRDGCQCSRLAASFRRCPPAHRIIRDSNLRLLSQCLYFRQRRFSEGSG